MSVSGGTPQTEITTLEQCQGQCAANNDCLALDWDATASTRCWFHLNSVGDRRSSQGVIHYVVSDRCPRGEYWGIYYCSTTTTTAAAAAAAATTTTTTTLLLILPTNCSYYAGARILVVTDRVVIKKNKKLM